MAGLQLGDDGREEILLTRKATGDVNTLIDIELVKIGGHYYGASEALADLELNTSYELDGLLVQLTGQYVQSLDLPGIY